MIPYGIDLAFSVATYCLVPHFSLKAKPSKRRPIEGAALFDRQIIQASIKDFTTRKSDGIQRLRSLHVLQGMEALQKC
jgi:hypothetical protein